MTWRSLLLLSIAALLEVGGDAIVRLGLGGSGLTRIAFFALGALTLFAYGVFVNSGAADFGRLLGVYVVIFFIVAQAIDALLFGVPIRPPILVGGAFVALGGAVVAFWRT